MRRDRSHPACRVPRALAVVQIRHQDPCLPLEVVSRAVGIALAERGGGVLLEVGHRVPIAAPFLIDDRTRQETQPRYGRPLRSSELLFGFLRRASVEKELESQADWFPARREEPLRLAQRLLYCEIIARRLLRPREQSMSGVGLRVNEVLVRHLNHPVVALASTPDRHQVVDGLQVERVENALLLEEYGSRFDVAGVKAPIGNGTESALVRREPR